MTRHELREQIFKTVFQIPFYDGYVPALDLEDISGKESEDVDDILPEEIQKDIDYIDNKVTAIQDRVSEIDNEIYNGIYNLYDIIFEHSKFAGRTDDDALNEFRAIMNGIWLSSEERYSLLI